MIYTIPIKQPKSHWIRGVVISTYFCLTLFRFIGAPPGSMSIFFPFEYRMLLWAGWIEEIVVVWVSSHVKTLASIHPDPEYFYAHPSFGTLSIELQNFVILQLRAQSEGKDLITSDSIALQKCMKAFPDRDQVFWIDAMKLLMKQKSVINIDNSVV